MNLPKYKDKEVKEILETMVIIIDSREKVNHWVTEKYDKQEIKYEVRKLNHGDYSFYIPKNEKLDISEETSFENHISIERKNSLDELAGSITKDRERFKREYERHEGKMILMIEDGTYGGICKADYRSRIKPLSYLATLHSWQHKFDVPFVFVEKDYSAQYIYYTFYYWLKVYLENDIVNK